jgi:hypothetical protein
MAIRRNSRINLYLMRLRLKGQTSDQELSPRFSDGYRISTRHSMLVALPEKLLNKSKVTPIDGVVNRGAVESGKDGVGFGTP